MSRAMSKAIREKFSKFLSPDQSANTISDADLEKFWKAIGYDDQEERLRGKNSKDLIKWPIQRPSPIPC